MRVRLHPPRGAALHTAHAQRLYSLYLKNADLKLFTHEASNVGNKLRVVKSLLGEQISNLKNQGGREAGWRGGRVGEDSQTCQESGGGGVPPPRARRRISPRADPPSTFAPPFKELRR